VAVVEDRAASHNEGQTTLRGAESATQGKTRKKRTKMTRRGKTGVVAAVEMTRSASHNSDRTASGDR
jgi:hypothetical protein